MEVGSEDGEEEEKGQTITGVKVAVEEEVFVAG